MPAEALRQPLKIFLSGEERKAVAAKASGTGLALSAFIRRAALGMKVSSIPQPNAEKWQELARLSANLNQLTKAANGGAGIQVDSALLYEVAVLVRGLRLDLIGTKEEA
jgi:hypothetical protein